MAEVHSLIPNMLLVLENRQNTYNHGLVNNGQRKPAIRRLRADMSTRAVTKITKRICLIGQRCHGAKTEGTQVIDM